jgi:hypothetical protein
MINFIPRALNSDGSVTFVTTTRTGGIGVQSYSSNQPMGTTAAVDPTDTYSLGARYDNTGTIRLYDATSALPAGAVFIGGIAFSSTGQLCYTTASPSGTSVFIGGVAVKQNGVVHAVVSGGAGILTESGNALLSESGSAILPG